MNVDVPIDQLPMTWMQWFSMDQAQADQRSVMRALQTQAMGRSATSHLRWDQDALSQLDLESGLQSRLRVQAQGVQGISDWMRSASDYSAPAAPQFGQDTMATPARVVRRSEVAELVRFGQSDGPRLLWVPAPINKANILDLSPDRSVVQRQLALGLDVYVLIWKCASESHQPAPDDYVDAICDAADALGDDLNLAGYCLGGALAALASKRLPNLGSLSLIAAPMDGQPGGLGPWLTPAQKQHTQSMAHLRGLVPAGVLAAGFMALKPEAWRGLFNKHRSKALTQWLLDGVNLSPAIWDWVVQDVYGDGVMQSIEAFDVPTWVQSFDDDHLVPPQQLSGKAGVIHARAPGGHNGGLLRVQPGQWLDGWSQWLPKSKAPQVEWPDLGDACEGYIRQSGYVA